LHTQAEVEDTDNRNQSSPGAEKSFEQKEKKNWAVPEKHEVMGVCV
jgi:hypothetical protein